MTLRSIPRRLAALERASGAETGSFLLVPADGESFEDALSRHTGTRPLIVGVPEAPTAEAWMERWAPA